MPQSRVRYEPLLYSDGDVDEHSQSDTRGWPPSKPQSGGRAWIFFVAACTLSLVFSSLSLLALSTTPAFNVVNRHATKTPSVYLGLERVAAKESLCRGRGSYPWEFYTFTGSDVRHKTRVHAPGDEASFSFGGHTSALLDFYFPDYGLENCTLTAQGFKNVVFDIYKLTNTLGDLEGKELISTLDFTRHPDHFELTTSAFYCPSRTHMLFLWTCPHPECHVEFSLKGVTHMTAGDDSRNKTGMRLTQWEHIHCIKDTV